MDEHDVSGDEILDYLLKIMGIEKKQGEEKPPNRAVKKNTHHQYTTDRRI